MSRFELNSEELSDLLTAYHDKCKGKNNGGISGVVGQKRSRFRIVEVFNAE